MGVPWIFIRTQSMAWKKHRSRTVADIAAEVTMMKLIVAAATSDEGSRKERLTKQETFIPFAFVKMLIILDAAAPFPPSLSILSRFLKSLNTSRCSRVR